MLNVKKLLTKILTLGVVHSYGITNNASYIKFANGVMIQWGNGTVPAGVYVASIPFAQSFVTKTNLSIQITPLSNGTNYNVDYTNTTVSAFRMGRTPNTNADVYYYVAFGTWK